MKLVIKNLLLFCFVLISVLLFAQATEIDTHTHSEKILDGTVLPQDDEVTFACMDSLLSQNKDTQNYYFKVMRVVVSKSDGALSTMVGVKLKEYLEKSSISFLRNFRTLDSVEQKNFSWYLANEYYMEADNGQEAIKNAANFLVQLKNYCDKCKKFIGEIDRLNQEIAFTIKLYKDEY